PVRRLNEAIYRYPTILAPEPAEMVEKAGREQLLPTVEAMPDHVEARGRDRMPPEIKPPPQKVGQEAPIAGMKSAWCRDVLNALPAAIYTTDAAGQITFFNQAAADFAGRVPELGSDQWCVTWRLYWPDGRPMAHGDCPMARALKEDRPV